MQSYKTKQPLWKSHEALWQPQPDCRRMPGRVPHEEPPITRHSGAAVHTFGVAAVSAPYHPPLTIAGQTYAFPHLEPFQMAVASQKVGRPLSIHVRFTNHCFSVALETAAQPQGAHSFPDGGGRPRVFCPVRYGLSRQLPVVVQQLNHPAAKVRQTVQRRNWLHSVQVVGPAGPYLIFFEIRRASQDKRHLQDLDLIVESAYPQGASQPPALLGSMNFVLLAGKTYMGEPVATRR